MGSGDYHYCEKCGCRMFAWQKDCDTCKRITNLEKELDRAANEIHRLGMKCSRLEDKKLPSGEGEE